MDNTGSCLHKSCSFTLASSESGNFTSSSNLHSKATHFHPTVGMLFFSPPLFILRSVSSHSAFTRLEKKICCQSTTSNTCLSAHSRHFQIQLPAVGSVPVLLPPYEPTGRFSAGESLWDCVFHSMPTSTPAILESLQL